MSLDITIPSHNDPQAIKKLFEALVAIASPRKASDPSGGGGGAGINMYSTETYASGTRIKARVPKRINPNGPCVEYWFDGDGDCSRHYELPNTSVMERPGGWKAGVKAFANDAAQYFGRVAQALERHREECIELARSLAEQSDSPQPTGT